MPPFNDGQVKTFNHLAFEGLTEKEFLSLYKTASVRKIKTGDFLFKEGDEDPTIYLILKGSIQVLINLNGKIQKTAVIGQGEWISPAVFTENSLKKISATVTNTLAVLVLDENILTGIPYKVRSVIYKNLAKQAAGQVIALNVNQARLYSDNKYLASKAAELIKAKSDEYADSEIIQNLLKKIPHLPMYTSKVAMLLHNEKVSSNEIARIA